MSVKISKTLPSMTIIVPCYNEEDSLPLFVKRIKDVEKGMTAVDIDLIFIDDGSSDNTLNILRELATSKDCISYISLSRNFGKEAALFAGLRAARGDYIAIMDADLQDPPELLADMYSAIVYDGFDCAATRRVTRKGEPPIRSLFARMFYRLINKLSQIEIVDGARDFRLMTRQVVDVILSISEYNRFTKGIFSWVGFKTKWIEFDNVPRIAGSTKWSFWKLFLYSIDGIVAFSTAPLAFSSLIGVLFCFLAFIAMAFIIFRRVLLGDPVDGWASTVCIILFVSGVQLACTGVLGEYLAKTYMETKRRPIYIEKEKKTGRGKNDDE